MTKEKQMQNSAETTGPLFVSDSDFTPNPDRAIWIDGEINQTMEDRLRPEILAITALRFTGIFDETRER